MRRLLLVSMGAAVLGLSGCASMSGLDAKSEFACKAPEGVLCESMSGIYANAQAHNLPGQRATRGAPVEERAAPELSQAKGVLTKPIYSGTPIRSAPRVLRLWFAPWEDTDGDLHDQSYVYLPVDSGQWLIEHNRRRIQDTHRPVRAPTNFPAPGADTERPERRGSAPQGAGAAAAGSVSPVRMTNEQAAAMLDGILKPGDLAGRGE